MRLQLSDIVARDSCQLPTAGFEGVVRTLGPEIGTGPLVEPEPALFPLLCRLLQPLAVGCTRRGSHSQPIQPPDGAS